MRRCSLPAMLACLTLSGCGGLLNRTGETVTADKPPIVETTLTGDSQSTGEYEIGEPLQINNLTVFPVLSKAVRNEDRFITLDEGLKAGTVEVSEVGAQSQSTRRTLSRRLPAETDDEPIAPLVDEINDVPSPSDEGPDFGGNPSADEEFMEADEFGGPDVNRLIVVNRSDKPLYLMPGEVVVGGSQDRTIAESVILAANGEPTEIDVYCVEHGRWGQRDGVESGHVIMALTSDPEHVEALSEDASEGKFVVGAGLLNKASRVAAADRKGQGEVWDEVARANGKLNVNSSSDAFTFNFVDAAVQEKLLPYQSSLKGFEHAERIVGVIVAINGKPETVNVFESTPLFRKLWPKLMKGYCLDAIQVAEEGSSAATCSHTAAEDFLTGVFAGDAESSRKSRDGLVLSRRETDQSVGFSAGGGMGGMGGAVHSSGFSK